VLIIRADSTGVNIELQNCSNFTSILALLKLGKFHWDPKAERWKGSVFQFDEARGHLEEFDVVRVQDEDVMAKLRDGDPEQIISKQRVLMDWNLLNYPPVKGKAPFENFQIEDIGKGITRNRYAYYLGMGAGKSFIASALVAHYYIKTLEVGKVILLTTSIGVRNLRMELLKFVKGLDPEKIAIVDKDFRNPFNVYVDADILIMSYNSFRLMCNYYKKELKISATKPRKPFLPITEWSGESKVMLLLDESHNIAIHDSQQSHLIALHSKAFEYRYLFSGTPADKPEKLYNQFKTLDESLTHRLSYTDWLAVYANVGTRFSAYDVRDWKQDKLNELNEKFVARYGVYRDSADIIELPEHYEKRVFLKMSSKQRAIYEEFVQTTIASAMSSGKGSTQAIVNSFPYLLLASENPFLLEKHLDKFDDRLASRILAFKAEDMEKLTAAEEIVEDHKGEKGVIWVSHPRTAELLVEKLKASHPIVIVGSTDEKVRNDLITQFKTNPENEILIANIQVLNTSVTITEATYQIYVERIFAYSPYSQSMARIYRIGQNKTVTTYILLYERSLDILQDKNLSSKDTLVKKLLAKDFLTQEEWRRIFNADVADEF